MALGKQTVRADCPKKTLELIFFKPLHFKSNVLGNYPNYWTVFQNGRVTTFIGLINGPSYRF